MKLPLACLSPDELKKFEASLFERACTVGSVGETEKFLTLLEEMRTPPETLYSIRIMGKRDGALISVVKLIRELRPNTGLAEAKKLAESADVVLVEDLPLADARKVQAVLEKAGALVRLESPVALHNMHELSGDDS
jgi:ribosomal protein L7/L12